MNTAGPHWIRDTARACRISELHLFVRGDRDPFAFAGLWETARLGEETIRSAAIIVTEANAVVAKAMLLPFPPELMEAYPVSKRVNSHVNDDEGLTERVEIVPEREAPAEELDLLGAPVKAPARKRR